jgi:hypothetical protein
MCARIASLLPDHFEANRMDEGLLRQTFQAFLCGKLECAVAAAEGRTPPAAVTDVSFPPLMMTAMKRAWISSTQVGSADADRSSNSSASSSNSSAAAAVTEVQQASGPHSSEVNLQQQQEEEEDDLDGPSTSAATARPASGEQCTLCVVVPHPSACHQA